MEEDPWLPGHDNGAWGSLGISRWLYCTDTAAKVMEIQENWAGQ